MTRPVQVGSAASAACADRSSHGSSVVASTLDPEALEERTRPVGVLGEPVGELVVDRVRASARTAAPSRRRSPPARPPARSAPACRGRRPSARTARRQTSRDAVLVERAPADAEGVQRHAARVQQARHVVVGRDEQASPGPRTARRRAAAADRRGRAARSIGRSRDGLVQPPRDRAHAGLRRQQPVRMEPERHSGAGHATHSAHRRPASAISCHGGGTLRPSWRPDGSDDHARDDRPSARRGSAGPIASSARTQVRAFVHEQLAARRPRRRAACACSSPTAPAAARCRSCCRRVHGALHGARQPADRARRARHARAR